MFFRSFLIISRECWYIFLKCIHRISKLLFISGKEYTMFFKKRFDFKKSMNIYKCILCILLWKNLPIRNRFDSKRLKSFLHRERRSRFVCFRALFDMHLRARYQFFLIRLLKNDGYIVIHSNRYNYHPVLKQKVMKFELYHWLVELLAECRYLPMKT